MYKIRYDFICPTVRKIYSNIQQASAQKKDHMNYYCICSNVSQITFVLLLTQLNLMNRQLLCVADEKAVNYTSMVLHTCLDETKVQTLAEPQNIQIALRVMELCRTHPDLDWT